MALRGMKVIELAGLAPAPFCGMIMSDFGANVIRVDKPFSPDVDRLARGKRSIVLDLKKPEGVNVLKSLCSSADVLIEPFRRGVMEKIGLGPNKMLAENPKLIYARLTGFGQSGPYADMAGHDINFSAVSGLLSMLGRKDSPPTPPINLLADFAGGGLVCALGITMALLERTWSGAGQVIDCSMVEGAAYIGTWLYSSKDLWIWGKGRGENWLDSGAHFYDTYKTSDDKWMAVGAVEPQFYSKFINLLGLDEDEVGQFDDYETMKKIVSSVFCQKTQEEWRKIFDGQDACVTPVLDIEEAPYHSHNKARNFFVKSARTGEYEPGPAPLLMRTPAKANVAVPPPNKGQHTEEILTEAGYSKEEISGLVEKKVVGLS
ncbi:alpha-methylacyl-CoA racemase [Oratosquilla oratoria]|uniref:alpha-methylacyl-CoA racemase n=1 Tax=Oratosquilla oratoria TaxID=337810 RepID=UPI003F765EAA